MKLLYLVDDDFDILVSLSKWLRIRKFDVRTFSGSAPLYAAMDEQLPDIILLDIILHGEDGRDICKNIKQRFSKSIPVILYSALFGSMKEANANCADDFVAKTAGVHELLSRLENQIKIEPTKKE